MARRSSESKADWLAQEVAKAVDAGKPWASETVDFSDPQRPLTCLEVDFPILPINQIAAIEGNAGKPIYQMSKWWARRRSSVFRSMLIAAATKAPDDPSEAAKVVWDVYYGNHQKKGSFKNIKVADIFMGGGTTIVEGSRLGMQMYGNDLNPVAWFVVKNEMAKVNNVEVEKFLSEIEHEVKPQIQTFYACDCPRGHKGKWKRIETGEVMADDFDPITLLPEERKAFSYEGPEIIYVFWAKHGPCQVTGCGHRTPIMSNPVMAVKAITIKYWSHKCEHCRDTFDLEEHEARMAPGVPFVVAESERPYAVLDGVGVTCPLCGKHEKMVSDVADKASKKIVELSLVVHPAWLKGESKKDNKGKEYGGSADDEAESTIRWNKARATTCRLVEVRGKLPEEITCPETKVTFKTGNAGGTVPKKSNYACGSCGTVQDILKTVKASEKNGPVGMYAIQGFCPKCKNEGQLYGGRFFAPVVDTTRYDAALWEWERRKDTDLNDYWPRSAILPGAEIGPHDVEGHHFHYWYYMFNQRQLLLHAVLLKAVTKGLVLPERDIADFTLGAYQQYLRNQVMFCFWNIHHDELEPFYSDGHFHPKATMIENSVYLSLGRGNWRSCSEGLVDASEWTQDPWELVSNERLAGERKDLAPHLKGKSEKVYPGDALLYGVTLSCTSSTDLLEIQDATIDLVITDPPFAGLEQYAELSDFFYVWLRLALKDIYQYFVPEYTPKTLEAVSNKFRQPDDPDAYFQRVLTDCWKEAHRILKPGGILAFTFHHSKDAPWVQVLESLFDSGFYLSSTYPILGDESKGDGQFGSQQIEYDIIHVCRKRTEDPKPISWAKMRRQVLQDVHRIKELLEHHQKEGLPDADLQVIRRGKALEYFSRHYGKVFKDEETPITVLEALVGINQILDEDAGGVKESPPHNAEPFTRMFLRLFDGHAELPRDQMQKFLRGTGAAPSDFLDRGWCQEKSKVFHLTSPLEIAQTWYGKHRRGMTSDYDQAVFLIGACFDSSGINANETLNNDTFKPHPALGTLLMWHKTHGSSNAIRNAAAIASQLYRTWETKNKTSKAKQMQLFFAEEDE